MSTRAVTAIKNIVGMAFRPMSGMGRVFAFLTAVLTILFVLFVWYLVHSESALVRFFRLAELESLDIRFLLRGPIEPTGNVVIVALDEPSIAAAGAYPIPRGMYARLIDRLADAGTKIVAFDTLFPEPQNVHELSRLDRLIESWRARVSDKPEVERLLSELQAQRDAIDEDTKLARAMGAAVQRGTWVICAMDLVTGTEIAQGYIGSRLTKEDLALLADYTYPQIFPLTKEERLAYLEAYPPKEAQGVLVAARRIAEKAAGIAYVDYTPGFDGVLRRETLAVRFRGNFYMPLSVMTVWYYYDAPLDGLWLKLTEGIEVVGTEAPGDTQNRMLINYRGPSGTFPRYSLHEVAEGDVAPEAFRGKIVFVGATAQGTGDFVVTPYSARFPGVEKHATVADNILKGDFIEKGYYVTLVDIGSIIGLGVLAGLLLPLLSPLSAFIFTLMLWGGWMLFTQHLFVTRGVWMNVVYPSLTIFIGFSLIMFYRFAVEERGRRQVKRLFQKYMDPAVVDQMLKSAKDIKLGGDKMEVTVFFSDVTGFTRLSERLDESEVIALLNRYFPLLTDVILSHGGFVNKYQGDAIVAAFGVPLKQEDHAKRACFAALECQKELVHLNDELKQSGMSAMVTRIGLSSGPAVVGNVGSARRAEYTVIGDAINVGQRLEVANKAFGTSIIISSTTFELARDGLAVRNLGLIQVRGRGEAVRAYELVDYDEALTEERRNRVGTFVKGLELFTRRRWDEAISVFEKVLKIAPQDGPSRFYLDLAKELKLNPPADDWDGSISIAEK